MSEMVTTSSRFSDGAWNRLMTDLRLAGCELHAMVVYDRKGVVLRAALPPYDLGDKTEVYSLSKSFCATAIGFLVDEGKVSLDDRVIDLFPEDCPPEISEHLRSMRLRHILSMNTGHGACVMPQMHEDSPMKAFLAQEIPYQPGTHFAYNTGATYCLSMIVHRLTGRVLMDYLQEKLFDPLGITDASWLIGHTGECLGGVGLRLSCDSLAKLGILYRDGGVFEGKRLLSEEWVRQATAAVSDNSGNGNPDWCAGYGFQFWRNASEGYRGDGAFGQLCLVLPERGIVVAVLAETGEMQKEIDMVMDFVRHMNDSIDCPPLQNAGYAPLDSSQNKVGFEDISYRFDNTVTNLCELTVRFDEKRNATQMYLSDGINTQVLTAGHGHWVENMVDLRTFKPSLVGLMPPITAECCHISASCAVEEKAMTVALRFRNCPHFVHLTLKCDEQGRLCLSFDKKELFCEGAAELVGTPV